MESNLTVSIVLISMIFCHIVDDYYLQGVLAKMKQRQWWKDNCPDERYKCDFMAALFAHAFSWAFMIQLPLVGYYIIVRHMIPQAVPVMFVLNVLVHALVDNEKANRKSINLIVDQIVHMIQIIVTLSVVELSWVL